MSVRLPQAVSMRQVMKCRLFPVRDAYIKAQKRNDICFKLDIGDDAITPVYEKGALFPFVDANVYTEVVSVGWRKGTGTVDAGCHE